MRRRRQSAPGVGPLRGDDGRRRLGITRDRRIRLFSARHASWKPPSTLTSPTKLSDPVIKGSGMFGLVLSPSAKVRKMNATRTQVIAEVSRIFQLSWLKYLEQEGNGASRRVVLQAGGRRCKQEGDVTSRRMVLQAGGRCCKQERVESRRVLLQTG